MCDAKRQAQLQYQQIEQLIELLRIDWQEFENLRQHLSDSAAVEEEVSDQDAAEYSRVGKLLDEHSAEDEDDVLDRIQETALSVEVRSGWRPVTAGDEPVEYRIVLCTGGPHVEIRGELDHFYSPDTAGIFYHDWSTPDTELTGVDEDTLLAFAEQFQYSSK